MFGRRRRYGRRRERDTAHLLRDVVQFLRVRVDFFGPCDLLVERLEAALDFGGWSAVP